MTIQWNLDLVIGGMAVGDSFFVPCLDPAALKKEVRKEAGNYKVEVVTRTVIENQLYGVRVWRTG